MSPDAEEPRAAAVPDTIRRAILLGVGELYQDRERADLEAAMKRPLAHFRVLGFA